MASLTIVRSSKHTVKFSNFNKQQQLKAFLKEYRRVASLVLDLLWDRPFHWQDKELNITKEKYDCPTFISTPNLNIETTLSARALKCCSTQVCGMIKSATEKPRKRQYMLAKLTEQGKTVENLLRAIAKQKIVKPNTENIKAELNSICCDFIETDTNFNGFLQLKSIGKTYGKIRIPIAFHRHSNRLKSKGKLLNSFLVSAKTIDFRWELPKKPIKKQGLTLGADQGYKDLLTLSNGTVTPKTDSHGHSLETITKRLARKKKGGKAFAQTQQHRLNFTNWSVNQLNLTNTKEIRLEEIINITYKRRTSRLLSHWCNTLIRDKLKSKCEEEQVALTFIPSTYRSQRCSSCGWVQKSNRKRKQFKCKSCGCSLDSDLNAAQNLTLDLPRVSVGLRNQKLNLKGFYWSLKGFSFDGEDFTVSLSPNKPTE